jgi:predicted ATPase
MLKRLYIDNFLCFSNFEWGPGPVNLILGDNGSGKTALFETLIRFRDIATRPGTTINTCVPPRSVTRWERRREVRLECDLWAENRMTTYRLVVEPDPAGLPGRILSESVSEGEKVLYSYHDREVHLHRDDGSPGAHFPFGDQDSFLPRIEPSRENSRLMEWRNTLEQIQVFRIDPCRLGEASETEANVLDSTGANFASWYRAATQSHPERLGDLFADLKLAIPGFQTMRLVEAGRQKILVVQFQAADGRYTLDLNELSDGQRMLIANYAILHLGMTSPRIVAFDEPDNFVSISEIQPWLMKVRDRVDAGTQLFVISHHPQVIDYLAADDVTVLDRTDGGPVRLRSLEIDRSEGVRASEIVGQGLRHE